jgi:hypothetical protein
MRAQVVENKGLDPLLWAKRPQSKQAWDLIVKEALVDPRFREIVEMHVANGVCSDGLQLEYVWSFAAQKFVRPAWYQRANYEGSVRVE